MWLFLKLPPFKSEMGLWRGWFVNDYEKGKQNDVVKILPDLGNEPRMYRSLVRCLINFNQPSTKKRTGIPIGWLVKVYVNGK